MAATAAVESLKLQSAQVIATNITPTLPTVSSIRSGAFCLTFWLSQSKTQHLLLPTAMLHET